MASQVPASDLRYADVLAAELVRRLGYEAAERTCFENHWDGVLDALRRHYRSASPQS